MRTILYGIVLIALGLASSGCKREEPEAALPPPTEPWPAPVVSSQKPAAEDTPRARASYSIQPGSQLQLSLPAREETPEGTFRIVRGTVEIDLLQLADSRGTVEVDLGSVLMHADKERLEHQYTSEARAWMNLGPSRPDAELERARFARFVVTSVDRVSHTAPHLGRRLPAESAQPGQTGTEQTGADPPGERRRVTLSVSGQLEANGLRVGRKAQVQVDFHYPAPATVGLPPARLTLRSTGPLVVPLADHEIVPRDAHGRLVASSLELLGRKVGLKAHLKFQLLAAPAEVSP